MRATSATGLNNCAVEIRQITRISETGQEEVFDGTLFCKWHNDAAKQYLNITGKDYARADVIMVKEDGSLSLCGHILKKNIEEQLRKHGNYQFDFAVTAQNMLVQTYRATLNWYGYGDISWELQ